VKIAFRESFARDLKSVRDKKLLRRVKEHIEAVESADSPTACRTSKNSKAPKNYFRLKLGDYRIGLALENNTFVFVRFLDRKDIYKYFP